jgi:hypothetical protein
MDHDENYIAGLMAALHEKETYVRVKFTKVDGSERIMLCTLNGEVIEPILGKKTEENARIVESVIRVFDLEKKEFRSFRKDSIISYEIE